MKIKLLLLIICFCLNNQHSFSNPPETILLFSVTSAKIARFGVINPSNQNVVVQIVHSNGSIYLDQTIKQKSNFFQLLEMNKLPNGEYSVKITGTDKVIKKEFVKTDDKIEVLEVYEPKFSLIEGGVNVYFKNNKGAEVLITLEQKDEVFFSDGPLKDKIINKRYSLVKIPNGKYTIKLNVSNETYTYELDVKK